MRKTKDARFYCSETIMAGEKWAGMSYKQLFSPSMRALGTKARELYMVARKQESSARIHAERRGGDLDPIHYPLDQWEFLGERVGQKVPFYLNEALLVRHKESGKRPPDWLSSVTDGKRIYADAKQLKADRKKLVALGLLDEIPVGAGTRRNIKGVYTLSSRWRKLTEQDIEQIKRGLKK